MSDWFRNTAWDEEIERSFDARLRRARRKEQYLRIQAGMLAKSHPEVALRLLDRYFQLSDDFDHAQAHANRAEALLALGREDEAFAAYEAALDREEEFPSLRTMTCLVFPYLIATRKRRDSYEGALDVLGRNRAFPMFPVDRFRWHAAYALIQGERGAWKDALDHAKCALEEAGRDHSGLPRHPGVGLVGDEHDEVVQRLAALIASAAGSEVE